MLKHTDKTRYYFKNIFNLHSLIILYAILLGPTIFFFRGMIVGIMGLLLVLLASIIYLTHGGLISATWASCVMILTYFVSPFDISTIHVIVGSTVYFLIGFGLGKHVELIRNNQHELNIKNEALIREKSN